MENIKELLTNFKAPATRERILVYEDTMLFNRIIREGENKLSQLKKAIDKYLQLSMGDFTQDVYNITLSEGIEFIKKQFEKSLNDQVEAIKNPVIRANLLKTSGIDSLFKEFKEAYDEFKAIERTNNGPLVFTNINDPLISFSFPLEMITIQGNKPYLLEGDRNGIKEKYCSIVIDTPEKHELYDALMAVKIAYENKLLPVFRKNNFIHENYLGFATLRENFFEDNDDRSLRVNWVSFAWCLSHNKKGN